MDNFQNKGNGKFIFRLKVGVVYQNCFIINEFIKIVSEVFLFPN